MEFMKTAIAVTVIWIGTVGSCTGVSRIQPQEEQLSTNIPTADQEKVNSIHAASNWANPYLLVYPDGFVVISGAFPDGRNRVESNGLRQALIKLPLSAWPYGKVVALQEATHLPPGDDGPTGRNKRAAEATLKELRLEFHWWPPTGPPVPDVEPSLR